MNIAQLLKDGQHEEAKRACEAALKVNPDSSQLLECMGIALKNMRRAQEAMEFYDKALKIRPNARTWWNRGICVRSMNAKNAHEIAVESYEKAIELDPHFIDPMQNLGNVTSRLGDRLPAGSKW